MKSFGWALVAMFNFIGAYNETLTYQIDHSLLIIAVICLCSINVILGLIGIVINL